MHTGNTERINLLLIVSTRSRNAVCTIRVTFSTVNLAKTDTTYDTVAHQT